MSRLFFTGANLIDGTGDARADVTVVVEGERILAVGRGGTVPEPIVNLDWRYKDPGDPTPVELAKELNGYATEDITDPNDPTKVVIAKGKQLVNFSVLRDDGKTSSGCWIYSGCFNEAGNNMARRDNSDPDNAGVFPNWAWAWPLNRRIIYNRASADVEGNPWDPSRKLLWWNGSKWTGYDIPDIAPDAKPGVVGPFIMNAEGTGRLFALGQMRDGPFPAHYEPFESPLANIVAPKIRGNPVARIFKNDLDQLGTADEFPYAGTSYRLTEHFHFWTKHVRFNAVVQPEFFVEIPEQLAAEKGIKTGHWVQVRSKRGAVKAKAVVSKRINTLICDGKPVHVIGVPLHWAFIGETKEGFGPNSLTPFVGDANTDTPEFKAFLVDIKPISGPDVVTVSEGAGAEEGDFASLISDTLGDRSRTDF